MSAVLHLLWGVAPWFSIFVASVVSVFVVFIGVSMSVALLYDDKVRADRAFEIFRDLLNLFGRGIR